jgi:hypothetical protein
VFRLANLFVEIQARDDVMRKQVSGLKSELSAMGVAIGTAAGGLAASAIGAAASALGGFISSGIKGAVDLKETMSKVGTIFGESAGVISAEADRMAAKFGVVKGEFLNAASDFGSAFKAIGTAAPEAAGLGNQLAKLGMDMASFNNASNEEAFTALRAALRGEFDPLERFNVMLSAAAIEAEALSLGLIKNAKDLDESAKKQATLSLIMKKTVDQQGDMERTADGSANSWRKLTGTFENLATELGTALEPAINSLMAAANDMVGMLQPAFASLKAGFESFSSGVVGAVETIRIMWRNLPDTWDIVVLKATEMGTNLVEIFRVIPANLAIIGEYIANNWRRLIADGVNAVGAVFKNLGDNIYRLSQAVIDFLSDPTKGFEFKWHDLLDGFKATADQLPELLRPNIVSMQAQIDDISGRIAGAEAKRVADMARKATEPAKKAALQATKKTADFKSEVSSVSEFALKLRSSILEGQDDTQKKQLEEQKKTRIAAETTAAAVGRGIVAVLG